MSWPQYQRARRRHDTGAVVVALVKTGFYLLAFALACTLAWLISGWFFMLAVGVVHRDWWPAVPLIGYRGALPVAFMLGFIGAIGGAGLAAVTRRS
jgi:hypothetical protein